VRYLILIADLASNNGPELKRGDLDIDRVVKGAPWTFNNHLLVFHRLQDNENTMQFGDFIGSFVEYYAVSNSNGYKNILRIKVKLGARSLLNRQKKIQISPSIHTYIRKQRWVGTSRYECRQGGTLTRRAATERSTWLREAR
ncbi:hypothetical protein Golax_024537, partial [Gossypium laxum]|nr:hypothetical protein [Gossypium laxum]